MARKTVQPKTLNDPRPRYSQGIVTEGGRLLFVAGQTASDQNGNVVGKGDIKPSRFSPTSKRCSRRPVARWTTWS